MPPKAPAHIKWQWTSDNSTWADYDSVVNDELEELFQQVSKKRSKKGKISFNGWNYEMDFKQNLQINLSTRKTRPIRRFELTSTGSAGKSKATSASNTAGRAIQKGKGVVDPFSGKSADAHVYESANEVFQCTLNQTDVKSNHNKFYVAQLLEADTNDEWFVFTRWGRVGVNGQTQMETFTTANDAISAFKKKFRDKTANDWDSRASFTKVPGKYYLMQIDYTGDASESDEDDDAPKKKKAKTEPAASAAQVKSKLSKPVQELLKLIGNKDSMNSTMKELQLDTKKMPLGKISKKQISDAMKILQKIEAGLKKKNPDVSEATSEFYTLIPHDFGFTRPPLINTTEVLKQKIELLETLGELEIASRLLDTDGKGAADDQIHPLDKVYASLKCGITALDRTDPVFLRVAEYIKNTHAKTHNNYKLKLSDVFEIDRNGETKRFSKYKKLDNHQMLWHGSRTTNYMGILSQGLRIAPPEAPSTGYMFGKGIYLADMCSKSANYCHTSPKNNTGLMVLCQAALGKPTECTSATFLSKPPTGFNSAKGVGMSAPNESGAQVVDNVKWPMGKVVSTKQKSSLLYPEYIVYDEAQVRMAYLVKVEFDYS